jgi:hypothetical protein
MPDPFRPQPAHSGAQVRPDLVATLARSIFAQPDGDSVWAQHGRIVTQLQERFPEAAKLLVEAGPDLLAFTSFPKEHWRQIWSNNPQERLNRELRRRTDVVGIFPNRAAVLRLVGAVLAEQHDEWAIARRYMTAESLAKYCRMEVRAWLGAGWWEVLLPGGGVVEVQPAGAVQGFFGGAGVQAGWQDGVLVAVAAGEVDGEAPPAGRPAVAEPAQRESLLVGELAVDIGELTAEA